MRRLCGRFFGGKVGMARKSIIEKKLFKLTLFVSVTILIAFQNCQKVQFAASPENEAAMESSAASATNVAFSPSEIQFGSQVVNTVSTERLLLIQNKTGRDEVLSNLQLTSDKGISLVDFEILPAQQTGDCQTVSDKSGKKLTIKGLESCRLHLRFKPTSAGSRSVVVSIFSEGAGQNIKASLRGDGIVQNSTNLNCNFQGQLVLNGSSITAYASSYVAAGQSCLSEQRVCTKGILSGSYSYLSCSSGQPLAPQCGFDNGTILSSPPSGAGLCNEGTPSNVQQVVSSGVVNWNWDCQNSLGSKASCHATSPIQATPKDCYWNGITIPNGQATTAYSAASVSSGQSCLSQQRVCTNGLLSGNFEYTSCQVVAPVPQTCEVALDASWGPNLECYKYTPGQIKIQPGETYTYVSPRAIAIKGQGTWTVRCDGATGSLVSMGFTCDTGVASCAAGSSFTWGNGCTGTIPNTISDGTQIFIYDMNATTTSYNGTKQYSTGSAYCRNGVLIPGFQSESCYR